MKEEKIKVLYVAVGKEPEMITIDNTLAVMQALVDGWIECTYPWDDKVTLVSNEEGMLEKKPFNRLVTSDQWDDDFKMGIFGNFFISSFDDDGNFSSLNDEQIKKYTEMFSLGTVRLAKGLEKIMDDYPIFGRVCAGRVASCTLSHHFTRVQWVDEPEVNMQEIRYALAAGLSQLVSQSYVAPHFVIEKGQYTFFMTLTDLRPTRPAVSGPVSIEMTYHCAVYETPALKLHQEKAANGIRILTPEYKEKFRIGSGQALEVDYPNGDEKIFVCYYVDDDHFMIENRTYHVCEFADLLDKLGATCCPVEQN